MGIRRDTPRDCSAVCTSGVNTNVLITGQLASASEMLGLRRHVFHEEGAVAAGAAYTP